MGSINGTAARQRTWIPAFRAPLRCTVSATADAAMRRGAGRRVPFSSAAPGPQAAVTR